MNFDRSLYLYKSTQYANLTNQREPGIDSLVHTQVKSASPSWQLL
jgi:hypothetical protein